MGGKSVWWQWTASAAETVYLNTTGSTFDTVVAVFSGTALTSLSRVAGDDDHGTNGASALSFNTWPGMTCRIMVDGFNPGMSAQMVIISPSPNACLGKEVPKAHHKPVRERPFVFARYAAVE